MATSGGFWKSRYKSGRPFNTRRAPKRLDPDTFAIDPPKFAQSITKDRNLPLLLRIVFGKRF
jgi:hypothetical protein